MSGTRRFDRLRVVSPCTTDWNEMKGTEQKRHCEQCNKHVFDFSKMSRREAEKAASLLGNRLCARISLNPDGTIRTQPPSSKIHPIVADPSVTSRRSSAFTTAVAATMLGLGAMSMTLPVLPAIAGSASQQQTQKKKGNRQTAGATAELFGTVMHTDESPIERASVTLRFLQTGETRQAVSDENGIYRFTNLQPGSYSLNVEAGHLMKSQINEMHLYAGATKRRDVTLRMPVMGAVGIPQIALRELHRNSDLVVTARVGEIAVAEKGDREDLRKIAVSLTSVLKGEVPEQTIEIYDWKYKSADQNLRTGAHLLLFLRDRDPDPNSNIRGGYEISGWGEGVKEITDETLPVWRARIQELSQFELQEVPRAEEVTEWMVKLIENPLTRWDGVSDLLASVNSLKWAEERQEAQKAECQTEKCADDEAVDKNVHPMPQRWNQSRNPMKGQARFAAALTEAHKSRIASILFETESITQKDMPLIELVSTWDDKRLIPLAASRLSSLLKSEENENTVSEVNSLLEIIVEKMDDEALTELKENYETESSAIYEKFYAEQDKASLDENSQPTTETEEISEESDEVTEEIREEEESDVAAETENDPEEEKRQQELEAKLEAVRTRFLKKFLPLLQQKIQAQTAGHLKSN